MRYYLFVSFIFVTILWHSCWSDCNPYRMEDPKSDTLQGVMKPYVDSLQPDVIKWKVEPEMIEP